MDEVAMHIRLECLKLALGSALNVETTVANAKAYAEFVIGGAATNAADDITPLPKGVVIK